jgi:hypothetical protein
MAWQSAARQGTARQGTAKHGHGMAWHGMAEKRDNVVGVDWLQNLVLAFDLAFGLLYQPLVTRMQPANDIGACMAFTFHHGCRE